MKRRTEIYRRATPLASKAAWVLRRGNHLPPLRRLGVGINRGLMRLAAHWLGRQPGVAAVFARHGVVTEDFVPWVSDLDLDVVMRDLSGSDQAHEVWQTFESLKKGYPLFGELEVFSEQELDLWLRWGGVEAWEACTWLRLHGDARLVIPPAVVPLEPRLTTAVAVMAFSLLFWQVYGLLFSPVFSGEALVKVLTKVLRVLSLTRESFGQNLYQSRRGVIRELKTREPEIVALLTRIMGRRYQRLEPEICEVLQYLLGRIMGRLPEPPGEPVAAGSLRLVMDHERDTRAFVLDRLRPAIIELEAIDGVVESVLLSGRMGDSGAVGNYDYKLYLRLCSRSLGAWGSVLSEVREVFDRHREIWPFNYFGACSLPILVPEEAFCFATRVWDPIEGYELDLRRGQESPAVPFFVERSLAFFANTNRHHRGFAANRPFTDRVREDFGAELTLVDYVFTLAQLRLALETEVLAVTPGDIVDRYRAELGGATDLATELETWYRRYADLSPEAMPGALDMAKLRTEAAPLIHCQQRAIFSWLAKADRNGLDRAGG